MVFAEDLSQRINFQILPKTVLLNLTDDFRNLDSIIDDIDTDQHKFVFNDLHWSILTIVILIIASILVGIYLRVIRKALINKSRSGQRIITHEELKLMAGIERRSPEPSTSVEMADERSNVSDIEYQKDLETKKSETKSSNMGAKDAKVKLPYPKH